MDAVGLRLGCAEAAELATCGRDSVAAFHPAAAWATSAFLAVRWLEYSCRAFSHRGGLPVTVEPHIRLRGPEPRPARCLLHRGLALPCRPQRQPRRLPEA